jgi:hypothetical protein
VNKRIDDHWIRGGGWISLIGRTCYYEGRIFITRRRRTHYW